MKLTVLIMAIGLGGSLGALARHLSAMLFHGTFGLPEYVAIMIVNISGCFLIGLVFFLIEGLFKKDSDSKLKNCSLAKPLCDKGWWPEPDPTAPVFSDFESDLRAELLAGFLITGFLGGMTTFSLFSLISLNLAQNGQFAAVLVNAAGTVIAGWVATYLGLALGRALVMRHPKSREQLG